jgi:hypothetical protein
MTTRPNTLSMYKHQTQVSWVCNSTEPNRLKKLGFVIVLDSRDLSLD